MEYTYPAAKGAAPWHGGWPQSPTAAPAGKNPWAGAPSGKYAAPWTDAVQEPYTPWSAYGGYPAQQMMPGGFPAQQMMPGGFPAQKMMPGGFPAQQMMPGGYPAQQMMPGGFPAQKMMPGAAPQAVGPMYMDQFVPATGGFQKGDLIDPMMRELSEMLVPALNNVLPAIQGLLRIPAMLMEFGESAEVLSRWNDLQVTLTADEDELNRAQAVTGELTVSTMGTEAEAHEEIAAADLPADEVALGHEEPREE